MTHTNNIQKVTLNQLATILFNLTYPKGSSVFASIIQFTNARLLKTNNPYPNTMKLTALSVLLNTEYEKGVINQLEREGKDKSEYQKGQNTMPLEYGENNRFIGLFYGHPVIQYRPYKNSHPKSKYLFNGKLIDKAKIADFIPDKKQATNQGTDKEIHWRKVYLKNIRKMKVNGQIYKVVD